VIRSFKHRGLQKFFSNGSTRGVEARFANRIRLILGRLQAATAPRDMDLPGLVLHQLKGQRVGTWSVRVSGNWRITFRFDGPDVCDVDYEDYH
jgi:toxin HigB-1